MKFKVDECIPHDTVCYIRERGYVADTVYEENLTGAPDKKIWEEAQREGRFLITTDLDFSDVRRYRPGTHHGILLIRLSQEGQSTVARFIEWLFENYDPTKWKEALVVATNHKIRIRKSKNSSSR